MNRLCPNIMQNRQRYFRLKFCQLYSFIFSLLPFFLPHFAVGIVSTKYFGFGFKKIFGFKKFLAEVCLATLSACNKLVSG